MTCPVCGGDGARGESKPRLSAGRQYRRSVMEKTYRGQRIDGETHVYVDGKPLSGEIPA